jgi:hypothetical protein
VFSPLVGGVVLLPFHDVVDRDLPRFLQTEADLR